MQSKDVGPPHSAAWLSPLGRGRGGLGPGAGAPGRTWENRRQSEARPCRSSCRGGLGLAWGCGGVGWGGTLEPPSAWPPTITSSHCPFPTGKAAFLTKPHQPGVGGPRVPPALTVPSTLCLRSLC